MTKNHIAVVDVAPFIGGTSSERERVGRAFGKAFEQTGFAVVTGHGIPEALTKEVYAASKLFFGLPQQGKLAYCPPEKTKGRGYLPMGIESVAKTLSGETPADLCEALVFTAPHREHLASARPNIWPDRPSHLSGLVRTWCKSMTRLTEQLTRLSALALDLPEEYFEPWFRDPALVLRFVHYPNQQVSPAAGQLRYGAHHDYGALTILRQDNAPGGLEISDNAGGWKEVGVIPNSFVINVGDLMERWTNGRWRSTLHRVSNPDRNLTGSTARLSMVAFCGPNEKSEISCLPTCCSVRHPAIYDPVIAGDYVRKKIATSMDLSIEANGLP